MDTEVTNGPPLPARVRTAFAFLAYLQSRRVPCCHPPATISRHEEAVERVALRTLVQFMSGECEFDDAPATGSGAGGSEARR